MDSLQFQLNSPFWEKGTSIAAFLPQGDLVGSILIHVDVDHSRGILDDVFVLPEYRQRGIAKHLIAESLRYLLSIGVRESTLEVLERNMPAVRFIGKSTIDTLNSDPNPIPAFWGDYFANGYIDAPAALVCHGATNEHSGDPYEEEEIKNVLFKAEEILQPNLTVN
jgi:hypothetical protein